MSEEYVDPAEVELKKKLGIESWRNLSKDKFMMFVSDLRQLDKEVALKVVGQFPNFKELVIGAYSSIQENVTQARKFNWKSQKKVHERFQQYMEILSRELEREDLSSEERFEILDRLKDALDAESAKDSENKKFQAVMASIGAAVLIVGAGAAASLLGGNTKIGGDESA